MRGKDRVVTIRKISGRIRKLKPEDIGRLVDQAIASFRETLESAVTKLSVGDFVRLIQLRKEISGEEPGNVTVRWVDECQTTLNDE
jgi:hypothetical protein